MIQLNLQKKLQGRNTKEIEKKLVENRKGLETDILEYLDFDTAEISVDHVEEDTAEISVDHVENE